MATVSTDQNLTEVSYTAGELIAVNSNATLTINSTPSVKPGTIRVNATQGTILISNTSTTTPIVLELNSFNDNIQFTGNGVLRTRGRWLHIATGTGAANQTINFSSIGGVAIDDPGSVMVERERLGDNTTRWSLTDRGTDAKTNRRIFRLSWDTGTDPFFRDGIWGTDNCITHPWKMHCTPIITLAGWANAANNDIFNVHDYDEDGAWIDLECNHYGNMVAEANKTSITVKTAYPFFLIGGTTDTYKKTFADYANVWELGRVYDLNRTTGVATFGKVAIPSGSRVFYPNIHVTAPFTATIGSRTQLIANPSGTVDFDTCAFSGSIYISGFTGQASVRAKNWVHHAYTNQRVTTNAALSELTINGLFWGVEGRTNETEVGSIYAVSNITAPKITIRNPCMATKSNRVGSGRTQVSWSVFSDGEVFNAYHLSPGNSADDSNRPTGILDTTFRNIQSHGAHWFPVNCVGVFMKNIRQSPTTDGSDETVLNKRQYQISNSFDTFVNGFYSIDGGGTGKLQVALLDTQSRRVGIFNMDYDAKNNKTSEYLGCQGNRQAYGNVILRNTAGTSTALTNNTQTTGIIRYANVMQTPTALRYNYTSDVVYDGVQVPTGSGVGVNFNTSNAGDVDVTGFYMLYTNYTKTEGKITIGSFGPEAAREYFEVTSGTLGGTVYYDNIGSLYLTASGNQVVQTSFYKIKGVDSFQNVAPFWDDNGANLTYEYSISTDDKATWGAYKSLTAANLSGETLPDSDIGFHMRVRITAGAAAGSGTWTREGTLFTNTDSNYHIPLDFRRFDVSGAVEDSILGVFEGSSLLGTALSDANGLARTDVESFFDNVPRNLSFKLRKPGYQEITGNASFNMSDVSIPVTQFLVREVGSSVAGITIDGVNQIVTVTGSVTELELYDTLQYWSVEADNIIYDVPMTRLSSTAYEMSPGWDLIISGTLDADGVTITLSGGGSFSITGSYNGTISDGTLTRAILTLSGVVSGSDIVILDAGTSTERVNVDAHGSSIYDFAYTASGNVDVCVYKAGYIPYVVRNYSLTNTKSTLPISQQIDRNYTP